MSAAHCADCKDFLDDNNRLLAEVERFKNPRVCEECEGNDCEKCGGTGFRCVDCPTYSRAADLWDVVLQRAEAVVEAVRKRREHFEQEYGWICHGPQPWSAGVSEQDRIEFEALAAWEEGNT